MSTCCRKEEKVIEPLALGLIKTDKKLTHIEVNLLELSAVTFVSIWTSCYRRPEINTGLHRLDSLLNHKYLSLPVPQTFPPKCYCSQRGRAKNTCSNIEMKPKNEKTSRQKPNRVESRGGGLDNTHTGENLGGIACILLIRWAWVYL